jgi:PKD repeat protein
MEKIFTKISYLLVCFTLFFGINLASGQTINFSSVDPGPYGQNSTISALIHIDDAGGCINQTNTFNLYLSDASGSFAGETLIGSFTGAYASFVNGVIPNGTPAGTNYRLRVKSTAPAVISAASAAITISATAGIQAGITSPSIDVKYPDVFGLCNGIDNAKFNFNAASTAGASTFAGFYNEATGAYEATVSLSPTGSFNAKATNYTIIVKAISGGQVATRSYMLINNVVNNSFGATGSNTVCLSGGGGTLTYNVDISSPNGLQNNFPGNTYLINWGDGVKESYTFCDIRAAGGKISHTYSKASCGVVSNGKSNVYEVSLQPQSPYCGVIGTQVTSYAKVIEAPVSSFFFPEAACINSEVSFINNSYPGQDPDNTTGSCVNTKALYTWYVDGTPVAFNVPLSTPFKHKFTTAGIHKVALELQNSSGICAVGILELPICIQNPPQPKFMLPATAICLTGSITPTDQSIVDANCNANNTYLWTVTGPAPVVYAGGTNANSKQPQFTFTTSGVYQVRLSINTVSCGFVETPTQEITVNTMPVATLSPDATLCGNNQTLNFNQVTGVTKTTISGTAQAVADTYTWTVMGGAFSFENGTTANSQYPSIKFNDYATYTVTVVHKNNCSTVTDSQVLTFKPAPTVNAGIDQTICPGTTVSLTGNIQGVYDSFQWVGGNGTFAPSRNVLNPTYTPTATEINLGQVILTLQATTSLPAPCNNVPDDITIFINPPNIITSAASKPVCTGTAVNYNITSSVTGSTYTWTAALTSGSATGFTANGTSSTISDVITNNNINANAVISYTITPNSNGCDGTPFTLTVTVTPNPTVTPTAPNTTICNNQSTNITLTSNITGTNFTWTSAVTGSITGNSTQTSLTATSKIDDLLTNNGSTPGTVTYTITPTSANGCPGTPSTITITVQPSPVQANAGANDRQCNITSYQLHGNSPAPGTGLWTLRSAQTGVTFADATDPQTTVNGLQPGQTYVFRWTITASPTCPSSFNDVQVISDLPSVGGTTTGSSTVCSGTNNGQITLSGQIGNIIGWESSTDGTTWLPVSNSTATLQYVGLTRTTQYRAIVQNGNCSTALSTISTITVNPPAVASNAGPDISLCNEVSYRLQGNNPGAFAGVWTLQSGQTGLTFGDPTQYNTIVSGLKGGQMYIFRWTIKGLPPCGDSFDEVVVNNLAPVINTVSIVNPLVCAGQTITIQGDVPSGGSGSYTFNWESSTDNITWVAITGATSQDLTTSVTATTYFRRSVNSGPCADFKSNVVKVTTQQAIGNNIITTTVQDICVNNSPGPITGSTPTGADGNFFYRWQSSPDGTTWTDIPGATNKDYTPPVLTASTQYRRMVTSTLCAGPQSNISNVISIIVNPNAKAEYTFTNDAGCVPFVINSANIKATDYPDRNQQYTWYAGTTVIGTGLAFPGYTINTDGQTVVIKLVVTSKNGCLNDEFSHTFTTTKQVTAGFTASKTLGCGPLTVNFTNTSVPITGATYLWEFGNGQTSTLATPNPVTFIAQNNGRDSVYTVTLTATTTCSITKFTQKITVRPQPKLIVYPDNTSGCSPFTVTFTNKSPGTNNQYIYDWGDGTAPETFTDIRDAKHQYTSATKKDFIVKIKVQSECGFESTQYTLSVSPNTVTASLTVNGNEKRGCAPFTTHFYNNSTGGTLFTYDFKDGTPVATTATSPEVIEHTFTQPGTYDVVLTASNGCSITTATQTIIVDAPPTPTFTADATTGCTSITVNFTNTTAATNITGYLWDFGDGTVSTDKNPPAHTYSYQNSPYTVKLTATNGLGCPGVSIITNYIKVTAPPIADFRVEPDTVASIPNYHFSFVDQTTGDVSSRIWTINGQTFTSINPSYTFPDTGRYEVTLRVTNSSGCFTTRTRHVRITGVPGQLYVPNAFMPSSATTELQTFKAKGSGIKEWHMRIFNNWGQLVFETNKLTSRGEPIDGWDGSFKGAPAPQGVYVWEISATFINGTEWKGMSYNSSAPKRTGSIHLLR